MGTMQEDESAFAILVAGDTPSNLHQDKLGEYIRCQPHTYIRTVV